MARHSVSWWRESLYHVLMYLAVGATFGFFGLIYGVLDLLGLDHWLVKGLLFASGILTARVIWVLLQKRLLGTHDHEHAQAQVTDAYSLLRMYLEQGQRQGEVAARCLQFQMQLHSDNETLRSELLRLLVSRQANVADMWMNKLVQTQVSEPIVPGASGSEPDILLRPGDNITRLDRVIRQQRAAFELQG
jgi:hypothetical protein